MFIGLDLMGGDFAPKSVLEGVLLASSKLDNEFQLVLFGQSNIIEKQFPEAYQQIRKHQFIELVDAPGLISMHDSPTKAILGKKDTSIHYGFEFLRNKKIDAFISAGNTGAMLVGAMQFVNVIPGVIRPTISSYIPKPNSRFGLLADVGLNPDCRPDVLFQIGLLGSLYLKHVFEIDNPRVALLNIGSEKGKGNLLTQATYNVLEESDKLNFIGNIEGYDLISDKADVVVCDGFVGNVVLKSMEGFYQVMKKNGVSQDKIGVFNYENYGGTPVLGVKQPVIIGHGVSSPAAFNNMIDLAKNIVEKNLMEEIRNSFTEE